MKACVIGGGPSGIFISKNLSEKGIQVDLFEKENRLLGNYNYAKEKTDITRNIQNNNKIKIFLNSDHSYIDDSKYNFYVLATGGIQRPLEILGKENAYDAIDIIKSIYSSANYKNKKDFIFTDKNGKLKFKNLSNKNNSNENKGILNMTKFKIFNFLNDFYTSKKEKSSILDAAILKDKKIVIIGMGNVCLDLIAYLGDIAKEITVLCKSSLIKASFDNYVLRSVIDSGKYDINVEDDFVKPENRKDRTRYEILNISSEKISNNNYMENCLNESINTKLNKSMAEDIEFNKNCAKKLKESNLNKAIKFMTSKTGNIFNNIFRYLNHDQGFENKKPKLNLIFKSNPIEITKNKILYLKNNKILEECYDIAINSTGFIPNRIVLNTQKPIYHLGWCNQARGSLGDAAIEARQLCDKIISEIF